MAKRTGKTKGQCERCGTEIEFWPSQKRRFCSRSCRGVVQGLAQWQGLRHKPTKPRRGTESPCPICGQPVYRNKSQAANGQGVYCSYACANTAMSKPPVVKACVTCGKEMRLKPSQAIRVYCSKACEFTTRTKRPLERIHNGKPARLDTKGYVVLYEPSHPNKSLKGWQLEHRLVAEAMLDRHLSSNEHVHHVNGIKDDNRPENLVVMDGNEHAVLSGTEYRDRLNRESAELAEYRRRFGPLPEEV